MAFKKELLHYFLEDALKTYSENFLVFDPANPVKFKLNDLKYSAHISYVHDSGENRPNEDEARIQLQRSIVNQQRANQQQGYIPVFIGFYDRGKVFVAWEPSYIFSLTFDTVGSVYARKSHADIADQQGGALRRQPARSLQRDTSILALPTNALGLYLENINLFHQIEEETELRGFLNMHPEFVDGSSKYTQESMEYDFSEHGRRERKTIISKRISYPRNPKFTKDVFSAYEGTCAICSKQLGIVQAAHIIPHNHDDCIERVTNGIALCVEHHALYDTSLLMPNKDKKLYINPAKIEFLKEIGQEKGLAEVEERAKHDYKIPQDVRLQPSNDFLEKGIKIRLGQAD